MKKEQGKQLKGVGGAKNWRERGMRGQYLLMTPFRSVPRDRTPHFLVECGMAVRMILSLPKLGRTFVLYSNISSCKGWHLSLSWNAMINITYKEIYWFHLENAWAYIPWIYSAGQNKRNSELRIFRGPPEWGGSTLNTVQDTQGNHLQSWSTSSRELTKNTWIRVAFLLTSIV